MSPDDIEALFTRSDGSFVFARWGRPIAPVVFGVDDATLSTVKGAIEAVCRLADHPMAETDPELGVNLMMFFFREWDELRAVPDLDRLIPDLGPLIDRLEAEAASQYRLFRFDEASAIRAAFVFLRIDAQLAAVPAEVLALSQAVHTMLLWSDLAFANRSPLAVAPGGELVLRPEIGRLIEVAYDPVLPPFADDFACALRLAARHGQAG